MGDIDPLESEVPPLWEEDSFHCWGPTLNCHKIQSCCIGKSIYNFIMCVHILPIYSS